MSSTNSSRILSIYRSRQIMLELLEEQGFEIADYVGFNINEVDAMFNNSQLDMLLSNNDKKVYVKYYFAAKQTAKQIRPANLRDIIEDLFEIEAVLTKKDTLIIIIDDEPNDTIITEQKYIFDTTGVFVVIHNIKRLQYNILKHTLVPTMKIMNDAEIVELKKKYNLKSLEQLPDISRFDPQALAICLRPGEVCEIDRSSATALNYKYYRLCI